MYPQNVTSGGTTNQKKILLAAFFVPQLSKLYEIAVDSEYTYR